MQAMNKAAFLDRDGIINKDFGYVHDWSNFVFQDGIFDLLRILKSSGYMLFIVTNQSGVARGFFTEEKVNSLHHRLLKELEIDDFKIAGIEFCPHLPGGKVKKYSINCNCRKPKPGMIESLSKKHQIILEKSILIGDKISDAKAGLAAGVGRNIVISQNAQSCFETYASLINLCSELR